MMATTQERRLKSDEADDSGFLFMGSDLVVEAAAFCESSSASTSGSQSRSSGHTIEDLSDLDELQFLRLEGVDKQQRRIVRIVGKFLPCTVIDAERLKEYISSKLTSEVTDGRFCIVYFHTAVVRGQNSPGIFALRRIYEDLPQILRQRLEAIYVVHPGLRSRLLLATAGRFFLSEGFYSKVVYVSRVEFLWDHIAKKGQIEIPEFVHEHDSELESNPLMDYGLQSDPHGYMDGPAGGFSRSSANPFC